MGSAASSRLGLGLVACALVIATGHVACGGKVEPGPSANAVAPTTVDDGREIDPAHGTGSAEEASGRSSTSSAREQTACKVAAQCVIDEEWVATDDAGTREYVADKGWSCHTRDATQELACTHHLGAATAICNCHGSLGAEPGDPPYGDAGPIDFFTIPASDTAPSNEEVIALWKERCGGACSPEPHHGDAGE